MMKKTKALRQGGSNPDAQGVQRGFIVALYQNHCADEPLSLRLLSKHGKMQIYSKRGHHYLARLVVPCLYHFFVVVTLPVIR